MCTSCSVGELRVTYDNQQDEVDEVVEGMSIHHIVHDLHPALQSDHLQSRGKVTVSEQ